MLLRTTLSNTWHQIQTFLFPQLREEIGILTPAHQRLIVVLETVRVEAFVRLWPGQPGRPPADRQAIARAFIAKAVLGLPQTNMLVERLLTDKALRRLCGWEWSRQVPSEATHSERLRGVCRQCTAGPGTRGADRGDALGAPCWPHLPRCHRH